MLSAFNTCCMYSSVLKKTFTAEANTMIPDRTALQYWLSNCIRAIPEKKCDQGVEGNFKLNPLLIFVLWRCYSISLSF